MQEVDNIFFIKSNICFLNVFYLQVQYERRNYEHGGNKKLKNHHTVADSVASELFTQPPLQYFNRTKMRQIESWITSCQKADKKNTQEGSYKEYGMYQY